jgi:hypothetical protein
MEHIAQYRKAIIDCLQASVVAVSSANELESVVVADTSTDNYLLIEVGWEPRGRVHAPLVHIRLHEGRVIVEYDGTEEGITPRLIAAGIRPEDIELGFVHPSERTQLDVPVA